MMRSGYTDYELIIHLITGFFSLRREFLKDISPEAQDLISKILEPDPIKRSDINPPCFLSDVSLLLNEPEGASPYDSMLDALIPSYSSNICGQSVYLTPCPLLSCPLLATTDTAHPRP